MSRRSGQLIALLTILFLGVLAYHGIPDAVRPDYYGYLIILRDVPIEFTFWRSSGTTAQVGIEIKSEERTAFFIPR